MAIEMTKIFRPSNGVQTAMAQIYENHYNSSLENILRYASILKKDFPGIKDSDIKIHKYGGRRRKHIPFVEVSLGKMTKVPNGYDEVSDIEYIL